MRLPTVFTALSNILCGYFITHHLKVTELAERADLWLLLGSSAGLYLGGMVLNDVFDAPLDAIERPERPIPSGRISRRGGAIFGGLLTAIGVLCAAFAGWPSLLIALLIVPSVLVYNGWLKSTPAAPLGMGVCRFLNLLLGSSAGSSSALWLMPVVGVACGLATYVLGVTCFARNEAAQSSRRWLFVGAALIMAGLTIDGVIVGLYGAGESVVRGGQMALLLLALNLLMRMSAAIASPVAGRVQRTVGLLLMCLIFRDALVVFGLTGDARLSVLVIMLIPPAILLRRFVAMT